MPPCRKQSRRNRDAPILQGVDPCDSLHYLISGKPRRSQGALAVPAHVLPQLLVDLCCLRHPVIQHGSPLFRILVQRHCSQQKTGLQHDLKRIAQIVRKSSNLFGLLFGYRPGLGSCCHPIGSLSDQNTASAPAASVFDTSGCLCNTRSCCPSSAPAPDQPVPKWRNWQTRMVQVHVPARVWGFESLLRHHLTTQAPDCNGKHIKVNGLVLM
jgi:hypothetical protein